MKSQSAPRVGFLYNHDEVHQVAHTAPIIAALQRRGFGVGLQVEVLVSSEAEALRVASLLDPEIPAPPTHRLRRGSAIDAVERWTGHAAPLGRIATLYANRALLSGYDALVVPETTSTLLKRWGGFGATKLIHVPHGAGDRAVGFGRKLLHFDHVLLSGNKIRDRMLAEGLIRPGAYAVVGYPKFDTIPDGPAPRLFDNDRPVVLYNPHADPRLSSWYRFGERVLDFFAANDSYNLIFAPHVMLFRRRLHAALGERCVRFRRDLPARFRSGPNMIIDLGSTRSVDMTYTRSADIYLGDASSQIYEFIRHPRPAFFLDAHGADWRDDPNYAHWRLGRVLQDPGELDDALAPPVALEEHQRQIQQRAYKHTFSIEHDRPSSERAADAIVSFLARADSGIAGLAP